MPNDTPLNTPVPLTLTELASLAPPAFWNNNVIVPREGFIAGYNSYSGRANWRAPHEPTPLDAEGAARDERHRNFLRAYQHDAIPPQATSRCDCQTCRSDRYQQAVERMPQPEGYGDECVCHGCLRWREAMYRQLSGAGSWAAEMPARERLARRGGLTAEAMRQAWGEITPSSMTMTITGIDRAAMDELVAPRETRDAFSRQRERRGHPLPNLATKPDWKPNDWEG